MSDASIIDHLANEYRLERTETAVFVHDILNGIYQLSDPANIAYQSLPLRPQYDDCLYELYTEKWYHIGDEVIHFRYGNEWLMHCFHPSMAHLERSSANSSHLFELFECDSKLIFRYNGRGVEAFEPHNSQYLRGSVSQKLFSTVYKVPDSDWMITLHSAAVSNGHSAVVFPAQAGSGKSTLSALLQVKGFTVLSDDFNVVNRTNGFIYRLPLAISVKEGSKETLFPFYSELNHTEAELATTGKWVHYLPVRNNLPGEKAFFPVSAIVFVQYSDDEPFSFNAVDQKVAIQTLLPETWVNPAPENVACFLDWFKKIPCYRLCYSVNEDAINAITKLFNEDGR